jgi:ribonuclease HII
MTTNLLGAGMNTLFGPEGEPDLLIFEKLAFYQGFKSVAGVDEAGRGALAGPVVAAAVILPQEVVMSGVTDSKQLTPAKREVLFDMIMGNALAVGVGHGDHVLVDSINILQATLLAMKQAVERLSLEPDYILVDGTFKISVPLPQKTIKKGDCASMSIAAASIIAKVTRDRLMTEYDTLFPGYGFAEHKGYGCAAHLAAITELGPCEIHRKTFRGVKEHVEVANRLPVYGDLL